MTRDRRKTYRVALRPCERLLVTIHRDQGLPLLGEVVDLSIHGAAAAFSVKPPPLPLGERVRIELSTRGGPRPIDLKARIASRSDEKRVRRYGLEFLERAALEEDLSTRMFQLFNRRGQVRIQMKDAPAAVRVEDRSEPETYRAALRDLSVGGVGLLVPTEVEAKLRGVHRVAVRFRLTPGAEPLQVVGLIRNRRVLTEPDPAAGSLVYGIEFDVSATRHADDVQYQILSFLRERERELFGGREPGERQVA